jgi:hypothetical protein
MWKLKTSSSFASMPQQEMLMSNAIAELGTCNMSEPAKVTLAMFINSTLDALTQSREAAR